MFDAITIDFTDKIAKVAVDYAIKTRELPFKYYPRDYMIDTQSLKVDAILVTDNLSHFHWLPEASLSSINAILQKFQNHEMKGSNIYFLPARIIQ